MNRLRSFAAIVMLTGIAACGAATAPDEMAVALSMGEKVNTLRTFTSTTIGNTVTVLGAIATPDPCYNFGASVTTTGSVIEVTVRAITQGGLCIGIYNQQNYALTLTKVPEGSWTLRVVHHEGSKSPVLQYESVITVNR